MKCIKTLYKSTYKNNAFICGKDYNLSYIDNDYIFIKDECDNEFSFVKIKKYGFYWIEDYFKVD